MKDNEPVKQTATPRFATLQYEVLHGLDISIPEYFYLDMIYYLSRGGWCYKSLDAIALDMKMSRIGVRKLRDRLIHKGLILKDPKGRVRTSVTYNKVYLRDDEGVTKYHGGGNKVSPRGIQSIPKNNNRYTKNNKGIKKFNSNGSISLAWKEAQLRGDVQ